MKSQSDEHQLNDDVFEVHMKIMFIELLNWQEIVMIFKYSMRFSSVESKACKERENKTYIPIGVNVIDY